MNQKLYDEIANLDAAARLQLVQDILDSVASVDAPLAAAAFEQRDDAVQHRRGAETAS